MRAAPPAEQPNRAVQAPQRPLDLGRLRAEASRIHRSLFGCDAPEEVKRQYASALHCARLAEFPGRGLTELMEAGVDLEAAEMALRRRTRANALTQRFQVLCYLGEARPEYFDRFVNEPSRFVAGVLTLGLHGARSLYKLIKGRWLLWIHHVD